MTTARARIAAMGLAVTPPAGWEATIYRRSAGSGAQTHPILHAATMALPAERGDYGGGLVELLGAQDVFVGILDFGPDAARTPCSSPWRPCPPSRPTPTGRASCSGPSGARLACSGSSRPRAAASVSIR